MNNTDNSFVSSLKKQIEQKGSLTESQYSALWIMMKPFSKIDKNTKINETLYPVSMKIKEGYYGYEYMVICLNTKGEKLRVYFSSLNNQKEEVLEKAKVLEVMNKDYLFHNYIKLDNPIKVQGTFDGYKVKRAKISI